MTNKTVAATGILLAGLALSACQPLTFSGKSEVTVNGETTKTYTADVFYTELNTELDAYYGILNAKPLNESKASELDAMGQQATTQLDKIEQFVTAADEIKGNGGEELKTSLTQWVADNRSLLSTTLPELAKTLGEDGKIELTGDVEKANGLLQTWDEEGGEAADNLNAALDAFYDANVSEEK